MRLLELRSISKIFTSTGTRALDSVDFELRPGEIHALVGENGAGKSTLARIVCGFARPDSGNLLLRDKPCSFRSHRDAEAAGIAFVPQYSMLAEGLSVADNLALGHEPRRAGIVYDRHKARVQAEQWCRDFGFTLNVETPVHRLSAAKRREAELLRALARAQQVLVLDEVTTVLSEAECQHLFSILRRLRERGLAIVYISHRSKEILELADRLTVLRDGSVIETRPVQGLDECGLGQLIVNQSACAMFNSTRSAAGRPILELSDIKVSGLGADSLENLNLTVHERELAVVLAIGNNGLETLEAVASGRLQPDAGSVRLDGKAMAELAERKLRSGLLAYIPSRRDELGLCLPVSIADNALAKKLHSLPASVFLGKRAAGNAVRSLLAFAGVKAKSGDPCISLSGGNRQRLLVARELQQNARCLVAAEPTQGLDAATRTRLLQELLDYRDRGGAVLLLTSDPDDAPAIADRILVLYRGRLLELPPDSLDPVNPTATLSTMLTGGSL